ncbi:MAG: hypothetical protein J0G29_04235 [Alphaproteobacteria bacterium]|nr:hypothetical protein [Alphaproteobacteria bacterium]OJV44982.1 MAG: hypothetical protein BGO28_05440 [Alphaproteobacteria bacterium 43-37]
MSKMKRTPLTFNVEKISPATKTQLEDISKQANTQTDKQVNVQTNKGRAGRQFIAAHVPPEAAKQFRMLAIQTDRTTQDLLVEAINDFFTKNGLSRLA